MKLTFPRYIYGMLQTPSKQNVYGDLQPVAYSSEFSDNLQREVYKKIRLGLNEALLQNYSHAYGFFPLSDNDFIAAHYELMLLTEPTSRGRPIFSEYYHITLSQLSEISWNLFPIFNAFTSIQYYEQVVKDISPAEIEFTADDEWIGNLRQFAIQVEAILVRYLSSKEKIIIAPLSGKPDSQVKILCALLHCLPKRYRKDLSFATLAKETSDSARIFFTPNPDKHRLILDWFAPTIPNLPGIIYANWVGELLREATEKNFNKAISGLVLPRKIKYLATIGDELDVAIRYKNWYADRNNHLRIQVLSQLEQLAKQIKEFSCIFTLQEAEEWLSILLTYVMKLSAYDVGAASLSHYFSIITEEKSRQQLINRIVGEILIKQEENLRSLTSFIVYLTEHSTKTNQGILVEFCKEILIKCLSSKNSMNALNLWKNIKHLEWANSVLWFKTALVAIPQVQSTDIFFFIVDEIGCPPDGEAFEALLGLLKKSKALEGQLSENVRFLENFQHSDPQKYTEQIASCFFEIMSYKWLTTQIRVGYENLVAFHEMLPHLITKIGIIESEKLLKHVTSEKCDLLVVFIIFSIILDQVQKNNSNQSLVVNHLIIIKECESEYISIGLEILQKHWMHFSIAQLESILLFLESKARRYQRIRLNIIEIRTIIQKNKRIQKIRNIFARKIGKDELGHIIFDYIAEFFRSSDIDAWRLFEEFIQDSGFTNEYHELLVQILLENQFFKTSDTKLKEIAERLRSNDLLYEADVITYWAFFRRGVAINPIKTIVNTLELSSVSPSDAGKIIGQENIFDKNYFSLLAQKIALMEPIKAEMLIEKLDDYLSKQKSNSLENRLRAFILTLSPQVIWIENCKSLSSSLKSQLRNTQYRRN